MAQDLAFELEKAIASTSSALLEKLVTLEAAGDREALAIKQKAIQGLASFYVKKNSLQKLRGLLKTNALFAQFTKPRAVQVVGRIIDEITKKDAAVAVQGCKDAISWTSAEKGASLLPILQAKLIRLYVETNALKEAGDLLTPLIKDAKQLDDKALLVDIYLSESAYHLANGSIEKAQTSLTACRAAGTSTFIPHLLTAQIEMAAGTLATLNKDYEKAFSYFYEAFEGFDSSSDRRATKALVYMALSKVVGGKHAELPGILSSKHTLQYDDAVGIQICKEVAEAAKQKSVKGLDAVAIKHKANITEDSLLEKTLTAFKESLLKENIQRVLCAYSRVQVQHVADETGLPYDMIEKQIVDMILDGDIKGDVDHRNQVVNVYDDTTESAMYADSVDIITTLDGVCDELVTKLHTQ